MVSPRGIGLLIAFILSTHLAAFSQPEEKMCMSKACSKPSHDTKSVFHLFSDHKVMKTNMFSRIGNLCMADASQPLKIFDLGEFHISSPYLPFCQNDQDSTSKATLNFDLPEEWGGFSFNSGISLQVENQSEKKTSTPGEHMIYVVSTKHLTENRWQPFLTLSYVRSQVKDISRAKKASYERDAQDQFMGHARYTNVEALGTCCGVKPFENLSMMFSYNYLKPLDKGVRLSNHNTKAFDDLKTASHNQNVDFRIDYAVKKGLNFLVKSEYLVPNGTLRDTVDAPLLIEGQLIVSF